MQSYEIKVSGVTLTAQYSPEVAERLGLTPTAKSKAVTPANKSATSRKRAAKTAAVDVEKETNDVDPDAPADAD